MPPSLSTPPESEIISVSAFTRQVKDLLETSLAVCWLRGEISNLRRQSSGHVYFTLKDAGSQLPCVLFRGDALKQTVELQDGLQVLVYGQVSVYEPRGAYQLICRTVLSDGQGRLQQAFEQLKAKLAADGLFDAERKRPLPQLPQTVAIVTSPTGAAIRDFLSILERRHWRGRIVVIPAKVQGASAAAAIVAGIQAAEKLGGVDLLVVGRGGGSLEDLWPFNEEVVARAVASCTLPVISAVGHEIDFTLTDFAADKRAETPSAAAELISSGSLALMDRLGSARRGLGLGLERGCEQSRYRLAAARAGLLRHDPQPVLEQASLRLDDCAQRLASHLRDQLNQKQQATMELARGLVTHHPQHRLEVARLESRHLLGRLERTVLLQFDQQRQRLTQLTQRLEQASLHKALARGFAIARDTEGRVVAAKAALQPGQRLSLDFHDGEAIVRVETL
ncbi:MAG: exodeoxyribonuclease VII large subunit [Verrucomicrobiota bacterium]